MPDDPSVILSGWREALERVKQRHFWALAPRAGSATVRASLDDIPPLLAAVEAVLKLHQPVANGGWEECEACGPNNDGSLIYAVPGEGETFWPCSTYVAITAALTGKEEAP